MEGEEGELVQVVLLFAVQMLGDFGMKTGLSKCAWRDGAMAVQVRLVPCACIGSGAPSIRRLWMVLVAAPSSSRVVLYLPASRALRSFPAVA